MEEKGLGQGAEEMPIVNLKMKLEMRQRICMHQTHAKRNEERTLGNAKLGRSFNSKLKTKVGDLVGGRDELEGK